MRLKSLLIGLVLFASSASANVTQNNLPDGMSYFLVNTNPNYPALCTIRYPNGFVSQFWLYPLYRSIPITIYSSWFCRYY